VFTDNASLFARLWLHVAVLVAGMALVAQADEGEPGFEDLVAQLQKLGLEITADQRTIDAATSEAAYFMFAQRKEHRPDCGPLKLPEAGHWLDRKPVFSKEAEKESIYPLFDKLLEMMRYSEVCVYRADVNYGMNTRATFTLYKLGNGKGDPRRRKNPEVLLGDADYVINLP
jgi:hypothetical protein